MLEECHCHTFPEIYVGAVVVMSESKSWVKVRVEQNAKDIFCFLWGCVIKNLRCYLV